MTKSRPHQDGGSPNNFFSKGVKNWLKIQCMGFNNFEEKGVEPQNFATWRMMRQDLKVVYNFWGGFAPLKFGKAKNVQNVYTISYNFQILPRISLEKVQI